MLNIGVVKKEYLDSTVRVSAEVSLNGKNSILFFETSIVNSDYICDSKADGFLVALLIVAMKNHVDITIESAVSARLLYGLNTFLIPALEKMNPKFSRISIHARKLTIDDYNVYNGVVTGVSGGVDSFYTILKNIGSEIPNSHRITHLVLFNAGNFGSDYELSTIEFHKQINNAEIVCKHLNLPLVWLNSNLMEFIEFPFEQVHTFCNAASALILQCLVKTYYYSSGYSINSFKLDFGANSNYDLINETAIKTEDFELISYGGLTPRFDKAAYIADFDIVRSSLNVCFRSDNLKEKINCSECSKCIRTMANLDVIGKLEYFDSIFDLQIYKKNKARYWGDIRYSKWRNKDEFSIENVNYAKELKYKIPIASYFWMVYKGARNLINKTKR